MSVSKGKAKKVLDASFVDNHEDVNEDRAMELVVKSEITIRNLKEEKSNDDKLNAATSIKKDLEAGYSSAINYEKAKISFLLEKIEEIRDVESGGELEA